MPGVVDLAKEEFDLPVQIEFLIVPFLICRTEN